MLSAKLSKVLQLKVQLGDINNGKNLI